MSVYFVQEQGQGLIKIGIAADVTARLTGLQTGSAARLITLLVIEDENSKELERVLHCEFAQWRSRGEWFRDNEYIRAFITDYERQVPLLKEKYSRKPYWHGQVSDLNESHRGMAKWLLSVPGVLEVMLISSDLPTVSTTDTEVEMDGGVWYLFRADVPFLGETAIRFVKAATPAPQEEEVT